MKSEEIRKKPSIIRIHEQYEYYKNVPERGLMIKGRPALTQIDHEKVGDFVLITVRDPCAPTMWIRRRRLRTDWSMQS